MSFGRFEKLSNDGTTTHGQKSIHWDSLDQKFAWSKEYGKIDSLITSCRLE